jgi:hypothetical protein
MAVIHRFTDSECSYDWKGVLSKEYDSGAAKGTCGKVMIGDDDAAP